MRVAIAADERAGVAEALVPELEAAHPREGW